ncbi:MAG: TrkA family potassium uptake protein [Ruminococcaceae bacterium]|nr:TrkA family potassium uptake protein [Oscillospiraceae bacterium]
MKTFAVIGLGRFGSSLAVKLSELGAEVLAVDGNMSIVEDISEKVTHAVAGDCTDEKVLRSLGIGNFDCAIVAMSENIEASILITSLLKTHGVPYVVAKAKSELHARVLRQIGADSVVFPEKEFGIKLAQNLSSSNILDFIELSDKYSIMEIKMPSAWVGKTLIELDVRRKYHINIVAVKDPGSDFIDVSPNPSVPLEANRFLVVIGANEDIKKISK